MYVVLNYIQDGLRKSAKESQNKCFPSGRSYVMYSRVRPVKRQLPIFAYFYARQFKLCFSSFHLYFNLSKYACY